MGEMLVMNTCNFHRELKYTTHAIRKSQSPRSFRYAISMTMTQFIIYMGQLTDWPNDFIDVWIEATRFASMIVTKISHIPPCSTDEGTHAHTT